MAVPPSVNTQVLTSEQRWRRWDQRGMDNDAQFLRRAQRFLWAVLIPVLAGAIISWMDTLPGIDIPHDKVWYILGLRGLLSIVPGTWLANEQVFGAMEQPEDIDGPAHVLDILGSASPQAFATPDLWIGAALGAAMIYGAIRLRRWRDEGHGDAMLLRRAPLEG